MSVSGVVRAVPAVVRSVARDVLDGLRKWRKGRATLDFLPGKPSISHVQGVAVFLVFIVVLGGMFSYQASSIALGQIPGGGGGGGGRPPSYEGWERQSGGASFSGYVDENSRTSPETLQITERNLAEVRFTLSWRDEPDQYPLHTNKPDELGIAASAPWGENRSASAQNVYDASGGAGAVSVSFTIVQTRLNGDNGTGDWSFSVFAKDCGNHTPRRIGLLQWLDNGNDYELVVEWFFYVKPAR